MHKDQTSKWIIYLLAGFVLFIGFLLFKLHSLQNPSPAAPAIAAQALPSTINLWAIFLTGLFTGGLTCLAVQGGLLATTIAQREEEKLQEKTKATGNALPILSFLTAKLIAYSILGFLLGSLGSVVQLSTTATIVMQFAVIIFMVGTAMSLLNVHPIFRYFIIQPPRFLTRMVRNQSKSKSLFAPAILGAFTVFIPCGTTQAMMALAIGAGNAFLGAAVLGAFVLGTTPLFFILGYFATRLGDAMHQRFMKLAAYTLIALTVFNLNGAIALTGSTVTLDTVWKDFWCTISIDCAHPKGLGFPVEEATIRFEESGYSPNAITVKSGSNIKLNLVNSTGLGCIQVFKIPTLGITKIVSRGKSDTVSFTAPKETGPIAFMCGMGMYRGVINVM